MYEKVGLHPVGGLPDDGGVGRLWRKKDDETSQCARLFPTGLLGSLCARGGRDGQTLQVTAVPV